MSLAPRILILVEENNMGREGQNFVLVDKKSGFYIAKDHDSGGYPHPTQRITESMFWRTIEEAKNYRKMFKEEFNWSIMEVIQLRLELIEED